MSTAPYSHLARTLVVILLKLATKECRIMDANCTEPFGLNDNRFTERAVNCENKYSDANCLFIYDRAVKQGENVERHVKCFQSPTTRLVDDQLVQMAVNSCPRTCGYCCLTPEFNCENKKDPRIDCSKVTREMCRSEYWRQILIEDCPNICGFCTAGCIDLAPGCAADPKVCTNAGMLKFVQDRTSADESIADTNELCTSPVVLCGMPAMVFCRRTCGYCSFTAASNSTTTSLQDFINGLLNNKTMSGGILTPGLGNIINTILNSTSTKKAP